MKRIIYYSSTGFPYALLVAAMRSGQLSTNPPPGCQQVQDLLHSYGFQLNQGEGQVYDLGWSARGEKCLALWSKGNGDMVKRIIVSFLSLFNWHHYQLIEVPAPARPWLGLARFLIKLRPCRGVGYTIIHRCVMEVYQELVQLAARPLDGAESKTS